MQSRFRIIQILELNGKVYVMTELIEKDSKFDLSDNSYLSGVPIENYLDIPRKLDGNGNQRYDVFVFVLKNELDRKLIKENDILELENR